MSFRQNQGQTESWMRLFPEHTGYDHLSINTNAVLNQDTRTAEFWAKASTVYPQRSSKSMTFAPTFGHVHHETIHVANAWKDHGHHIPWARYVILRIGQQAKAHPHITSVLKTLHPRF